MLVIADFISLGWEQTESFGAGWFKKVVGDILEEEYVLHYNFASGMLTIWNEDREKIFCNEIKNVKDFETILRWEPIGIKKFKGKNICIKAMREDLDFFKDKEFTIIEREIKNLSLEDIEWANKLFETPDGEKRVREKSKSNFNELPKK